MDENYIEIQMKMVLIEEQEKLEREYTRQPEID